MTIKSLDITHILSRIKSSTTLARVSGAANASAYDRVMVLFKVGGAETASAMGTTAIRVGHSDTVSGTYSGMTALSGITGIASATGLNYMFDFQRTKKFVGVLVSALSGSHCVTVLGYNREFQPSAAAQGFTSVNRIS